MKTQQRKYIGSLPHLKGETAVVRPDEKRPGGVLVQFDAAEYDREGNPSSELCGNWHDFREEDFAPETELDDVPAQGRQDAIEDFTLRRPSMKGRGSEERT